VRRETGVGGRSISLVTKAKMDFEVFFRPCGDVLARLSQ
jgi:hypothetical protein